MKKIIPTLALVAALSAGTQNAFAQSANVTGVVNAPGVGVSASVNADVSKNEKGDRHDGKNTVANVIARADKAIDQRIDSLTKLSARIASYKNLSADQKTSITASIQSSIDAMKALRVKIDAETDIKALRSDYQSITKDYRIFANVIPDERMIASVDNILATITAQQTVIATLQTKVTAAKTAGKDTTAMQASLDDATAKLTDAKAQGKIIVDALATLKPDGGDKTIQASNKAVWEKVTAARKAMRDDISAARKDTVSVRVSLRASMHASANGSSDHQ